MWARTSSLLSACSLFLAFSPALVGGHSGCGVGDGAFDAYVNPPQAIAPQVYHQPGPVYGRLLREATAEATSGGWLEAVESRARALQVQHAVSYGSGVFVPLASLHAAGLTGHIRISIVWDAVTSGDYAHAFCTQPCSPRARQCTFVGQYVFVQDASGSEVLSGIACTAEDVVTGAVGADRYAAIFARTQAALDYWAKTLWVRPVQDANITIDANLARAYNISNVVQPNADLVIIMTARPSPYRPVAGYASCGQRDQNNRVRRRCVPCRALALGGTVLRDL